MAKKSTQLSSSIEALTEQIESRKQQQQAVREKKQQFESEKKRRHRAERLAAPVILLITLGISVLVLLLGKLL